MKNLTLLYFLLTSFVAAAKEEPVLKVKTKAHAYVVSKVAEGFDGIWALEFLNDEELIFTEISGKIGILNLRTGQTRKLENVPRVYHEGQGGLLDVAVDPDFKQNRKVYLTYAKKVGGLQTTALATSKLDAGKGRFEEWKELFVASPAFSTSHHFGSRMAFDGEGHVFLTVGDRGQQDLAQSLEAHAGKVLRLNLDGSVPSDNPFAKKAGAKPEIWSFGHRNPQGIFYDGATKTLYEQEHGPKGGDEINVVVPGNNYGWPVITHGREYSGGPVGKGISEKEGLEQPLKYFVPSIAPSSLLIYRGGKLGFFKDRFVSGSLALQHLNLLDVKGAAKACEDRLLLNFEERIRDVKQGPDDLIYFSTDSGKIFVIRPAEKAVGKEGKDLTSTAAAKGYEPCEKLTEVQLGSAP